MKNGHNLRTLQAERKKAEDDQWVKPQSCIVCNKAGLKGAYGHWGDDWTCSNSCDQIVAARPRYPGHSEEDFFKRQGGVP